MKSSTLTHFLHRLRERMSRAALADEDDRKLLDMFGNDHDQAAFTILVQRYGPMVLGVCRRALGHEQEAEDAFQATFLVLVKKARAIRRQESLASWLHGVAYRIAVRASRRAAQRLGVESTSRSNQKQPTMDAVSWNELCAVLDEEIERLPSKLRTPLVLCCLQEKTHAQAASELGWPRSSVTARLAQAKDMLCKRLIRRGIELSPAIFAGVLAEKAATAAVPATLLRNTVSLATALVAGKAVATGTLSAGAIMLAEESMKAMFATKVKLVLAVLACSLAVSGASLAGYRGLAGAGDDDGIAASKIAQVPLGKEKPNGQPKKDAPPTLDLHGDLLPAGAVARLGADRWRNDSSNFAAFLPDGKRVVTVSPDRTIRVWEFPSGKEIKRITPPEPAGADFRLADSGGQVALSKDGKTIAIGGTEIYLCDLTTGKELARLKWEFKPQFKSSIPAVFGLAFSPDGEHLASITEGGTIRIWDWTKAKEVRSISGAVGGGALTVHLVYAPDGKSIVTRGASSGKKVNPPEPGVVKLWDLATGTEIWTLRTDPKSQNNISVAFSPDGKTLAFASQNVDKNIKGALYKPVKLVEAATGKEIGTLGEGRLSSLVFAKDGTKLYAFADLGSYGRRSELEEWDIASGKLLRQCAMPYAAKERISLSPDGNTLLATGSLDFLDLAGGKDITIRTGAARALHSLQFTPDGKNLFTTRFARLGGESVQKWDAVTGKDLGPVSLPLPLTKIELSPDGKVLAGRQFHANAVLDREGPFKFVLVDAASGKELGQITPPGAADTGVEMNISFSPDGTILAIHRMVLPKHSKIELYDVPAAKPWHTLDIQTNYSFAPGVFSADSKTFASYADRDTQPLTLGLWDTTTGWRIGSLSLPQRLRGAPKYGDIGAFTPDGRCLAVVMDDETVALFELATGQLRNTFGKKSQRVGNFRTSRLAFSADGKCFVVAGRDGTVYLWDIATGKELAAFKGHSGAVNDVAFARDGKTVASASDDGTALIWDVFKPTLPIKALTPADLDKCWQALAETDASKAWSAMLDLVAAPKQAVQLIRDKVKPAGPGTPPRKVTELLFQGEELRAYRAIEVLERIGTPEARQVLQALAAGAPGALVTTSAQTALKR